MIKIFYLFASISLLVSSCTKDKVSAFVANTNCSDTISFVQQIKPLINQNCSTSGCHDAGTQASGYNFTTYASIASKAEIMLSAMRHESGVTPMPLGGSMIADSLIQQFSCWTSQGKLEN